MRALDLLQELHDAGFKLEAAAGGGIGVSSYSALTEELRQLIRSHRDALLALLSSSSAAQAKLQAQDGRATVAGLEGRVCRLACTHLSRRRTCLQPVAAGLTKRFEIVYCELLLESCCPAFEARAQ